MYILAILNYTIDLGIVSKHSDLYRRIRISTALNAIYMYTYTYTCICIFMYIYKYNHTTAI